MINKVSKSMIKDLIEAGALAFSGYSGAKGDPGPQGQSGYSGAQGASGISGYSGYSGYSGFSGASGTGPVFTSDIVVVLDSNKTFGRYVNGDVIPATGKTPNEVILLATNETLGPIVSLSSNTTIQFNQTAISNQLFMSYIVNPSSFPVPSLSSGLLSWRRNNTGSWTTLSSGLIASATHTFTDTNFNSAPFNYRYTVTDSNGGIGTAYVNVTPTPYLAPTIVLPVVALSALYSPETNSTREKGNIGSIVSSTITRNSPLVSLTNYTLQYRALTGAWTNWTSLTSVSLTGFGSTASIGGYTHFNASLNAATSIAYRAVVTDTYQDFLSQSVSASTSVLFYNLIFYGPTSAVPGTSSAVRSLTNRGFTTGLSNPFILNTGTTYNIFTVAMPNASTLSQVLDLDALGVNITSNYVLSSFNVNDYLSTPTPYKVYTMTNAVPYSPSHRHQVTRT